MERSVKAALLSGLVFPGVGQLFLKRTARALLFLLPAAVATAYLCHAVLTPVMAIAIDIGSGALALDPLLIQARIDQTRIDSTSMNLASAVMIVAWLASTVDAYLLGRKAAQPAA
jgi:hypothetical protein